MKSSEFAHGMPLPARLIPSLHGLGLAAALLTPLCVVAVTQKGDTNATAAFVLRPGLRIELVASDPQVQSPVAMAFDEHGRLYVVERSDQEPTNGRIRLLEDPEGLGRFTVSTVFADGVPWASAIACFDDGVFVGAGNELVYLKDTRGTRRADMRRVVFSGFAGTGTVAISGDRLLHSFTWGPDNRIYAGTGGLEGPVKAEGGPADFQFSLEHSDFSFDPRTLSLRHEPGPSRSGMTFDPWGTRLLTDPDRPLRRAGFPPYYFERNPFFIPPPRFVDLLSPALAVFRYDRSESSRTNSTSESMPKETNSTNPLTTNWLATARGTLVYRGTALPTNYQGNVFIADPENHLIHRAVLRERDLSLWAERAADERHTEFLASTNGSFRPMHLASGPEGALYIADAGADRTQGRIYRIVSAGFKQPTVEDLSKANTNDLAAALVSPNAWHHDTAARLIYLRQPTAMVPLLSNVVMYAHTPQPRVQALRTLAGMNRLTERHLLKCLQDPVERVRRIALEYCQAAPFASTPSETLVRQLHSMASDPSAQVRLQLGYTLGEIQRLGREIALEELLRRDLASQWTQGAVLSSLLPSAAPTLRRLSGDRRFLAAPAGYAFVKRLAHMIGVRGDLQEIAQTIDVLYGPASNLDLAADLVTQLGEGLQQTGSSLELVDTQSTNRAVYASALASATDEQANIQTRVRSIQLLSVSPFSFGEIGDWLLLLLNPREASPVQIAAVRALSRMQDPGVATGLLQRWRGLRSEVRSEAAAALLARPERLQPLLSAMESGVVLPADLTVTQLNFLRTHWDPTISDRAVKLVGQIVLQRPDLMATFRSATSLRGSSIRGRELFSNRCAGCHRESPTEALGPNLSDLKARPEELVLSDILEPHRRIDPERSSVVVEARNGETSVGIVLRTSEKALLLQRSDGEQVIIPRANLGIIRPQKWSLMPQGLEAGLKPQDMADLLSYLRTAP